jgi:curved DNA-binding protein CbpA
MSVRKKDKRRFRRYPKNETCEVSVKGKPYKAETIDYSVDGLGVRFQETPPLKVGDVLGVNSCHPGLKADGQVVWSLKGTFGTKIGIRKLGTIAGALHDFRLSDVILGLHRSNKTGVLLVAKPPLRKSIYMEKGEMVFASSNDPSDRLGELLMREGKITKEQYAQAGKVSEKSGKRLGAVLVELGWIDAKGLFQSVTKYVENIIEGIFSIKEGEFLFKEGPLPTKEVIKLSLSVGNLIFRGVKKIDDNAYLKNVAPPPDSVIGFSPDPLYLFQDLELNVAEKNILKLIKGKKTVKALISESGMQELDAIRVLNALLSTRMIEVLEASEEAADVTAETVVGKAKKEDYEEMTAKILKLYDEHRSLGYYGVLGVKETDNNSTIKKAFYNRAKEYHPDKHFHLPDDMKDKLNTVFTYITTAYTTLMSPDLRRQYDEEPKGDTGQTRATNEQIAEQRYKEGMYELDRKNFSEAAQLFGAAAYLDDSVSKYHFYSGVALSKEGKYKEAERALSRALRNEPFKASYLAEAGHIYLALGLPKRAKGNFEKALSVDSGNKRALDGMEKISAES